MWPVRVPVTRADEVEVPAARICLMAVNPVRLNAQVQVSTTWRRNSPSAISASASRRRRCTDTP
jgi:hypothetical protein